MALTIGGWTKQYAGTALNISGYKLSFYEPFDTVSIAPSGTGARWYSGARADFGAATFVDDTSSSGPFSVAGGALTIKMQQVGGQWQSGALQTVNSYGQGFSQQYGYFEIRAKFPAGAGSWPAFWLYTQNAYGNPEPSVVRSEYDIVEAYGSDPDGHHTAGHVRNGSEHAWKSNYSVVPSSMFDGRFHTYGGLVTKDWVVTYYDGREVARMPTGDEFDSPLYMILDLAMNPDEVSRASGTYNLVVDHVKAYADPNISAVTLSGTSGADVQDGSPFNDRLSGNAGDDALYGYGGDDILNGGTGADRMRGAAGNDTYYVDNSFDRIVESDGGGTDSVISSVSFSLGSQYFEKAFLTGSSSINLTGNWLANELSGNGSANTINGNSGVDRIDGGAGTDLLIGGADQDYFVFGTPPNATSNVDVISDFDTKDDTVLLKKSTFSAFGTLGTLSSGSFVTGTKAAEPADRVIFDRANGILYYDSDGTGANPQVRVAALTKGLALGYADIVIV